jgi:hypothetical protein
MRWLHCCRPMDVNIETDGDGKPSTGPLSNFNFALKGAVGSAARRIGWQVLLRHCHHCLLLLLVLIVNNLATLRPVRLLRKFPATARPAGLLEGALAHPISVRVIEVQCSLLDRQSPWR